MKFFALLLLVVAFTTLTLAKSDYENAIACGRKNPNTNAAISAFCQKRGPKGKLRDNLVVPSPYAKRGARRGLMIVHITGSCTPRQWVPINFCFSQFHEMCANSPRAKGQSTRNYGNGGCQMWSIQEAWQAPKKQTKANGWIGDRG